ncbi:fam-l protein [Plasmodium malariae]|uniref:Fam-l protein n=2 Tax=Plasmodium malariae TaxID=5858 RepID=A0A1D3JGZ9_PLAMA|nr:fam-l protein [Plasmodium malariae]SBT85555.1 fam-l protein [Plasmodium malariae]
MNLILFIIIVAFFLLTFICQFYDDFNTFNKYLKEKHNFGIKMDRRNYRLLEKCSQNKLSRSVKLMQQLPNNGIREKNDTSYYEMGVARQMKLSNRALSNDEEDNKQSMKNKTCIFETKKYSHLEKKIFKELDYMDFLKRNRTISDKVYKKIILKKYGLRYALPLLIFVLLLISLILDYSCSYGIKRWLFKVLKLLSPDWFKNLHKFLRTSYLGSFFKFMKKVKKKVPSNGGGKSKTVTIITESYVSSFMIYLIYVLPFIILGTTLVLAIIYYHKKVKKFEKIRFRKR